MRRPAALMRDDSLIVPISSLDQADGDSTLLRPRPGSNVTQVGFAILEISLEGQSALRRIEKLRLRENGFEKLQREVLRRITLHVEIDECAELLGAPQHWTQPSREFFDGGFGVSGMDL